jgi:hypothetical protein
VSTTPASGDAIRDPASVPGLAKWMGFKPGMVVQQIGWDEDVDDDVVAAIEDVTGEEMVDENSDEIVEAVLLWYREDDGDLVDALVDAIAPLAGNGFIWLATPKRGRPGYVEPSDIAEAAPTAGLSQTSMATLGADWAAARLVARKSRLDKR